MAEFALLWLFLSDYAIGAKHDETKSNRYKKYDVKIYQFRISDKLIQMTEKELESFVNLQGFNF